MHLFDGLSRSECEDIYLEVMEKGDKARQASLCREDLYFLLSVACSRQDMANDWLFARCREFEADREGHLDLWARGHYKSTIITFGGTVQEILRNPNVTVGIFSHTRPIAKQFLRQIKLEFERNETLKKLFPDILYANPKTEAPLWSLDDGIIVKRKSNAKEATVEAWGLVDGQPTSKHFNLMVYDDVVTVESVSTPEQIKKTTDAWSLSLNLGSQGGRRRYVGTYYHLHDTYHTMLEREAVKPRVYPATEDGTMEGKPVFLSQQELDQKRKEMGPYIFSCQMLLNPVADRAMDFKDDWLRQYSVQPERKNLNVYILVDPAGSKKKEGNDYTVIWAIGLGVDGNYYLLDGFRDRLNLGERTAALFRLVRKWNPLKVAYEEYGMQADIEHIKYVMEHEQYRFNIVPVGGAMPKVARIRRLQPLFELGKIWFPQRLLYTSVEGRYLDQMQELYDKEYSAFPVCEHDDMLDDLARIVEPALMAVFPKPPEPPSERPKREYKPF